MSRNFLIAFIALLFALNCSSQAYIISEHSIKIDVDAQGNAQVTERFFLQFHDQQQLLAFREKSKEIGVRIEGWEAYDEKLHPYIGQQDEIATSKVSFIENDSTFLEMTYSLKSTLMEKKRETTRVIEYSILSKFFNYFISGSLWVIPQNTTIAVNLPPGAELQQPIEPEAEVSGNSVTWSGYKNSSKMTLNYRMFKQIASFDFGAVLQQLMKSDLFWVLIAIALIVCAALFLKRKSISNKIENYIVERSDLSKEEEERK